MTNNKAHSQETFAQCSAKNEHFAELGFLTSEILTLLSPFIEVLFVIAFY